MDQRSSRIPRRNLAAVFSVDENTSDLMLVENFH